VAEKVQISVVESDKSSDSFNCYLNEIRLLGIVNDTYLYTISTVYKSLSHTYDITVFCIDGLYLITHAIAADHLSFSNNMTLTHFSIDIL
jgi:hypothetical protein